MMSSRLSMLLAAVGFAGVLFSLGIVFGLGLLSAPEKIQADGMSPYLARLEGAEDRARRVERDQQALSPIYPSSPQVAGDTRTPAPQAAATDGSASEKEQKEPLAQTRQALTQPAVPAPQADTAPAAPAPVTASAAPPANATPIRNASTNSSTNACDVSACAAAYRSFRESDCTYQPFEGPRRLCVNPAAPAQASAQPQPAPKPPVSAPPRPLPQNAAAPPRPPADLDNVADEVRRLTREDGVYPPPSMQGGERIIVIER